MAQPTLLAARKVTLQDEDGKLRIAPACLSIKDGRIDEILELVEEQPWPQALDQARAHFGAGATLEDLDNLLLSPAFVNAHTHLSMSAFRGISLELAARDNVVEDLFFTLESELTAEDVRAFTRLGAYESILHGVGMVWDHYYFGEAVAQALRDVGLAGVVAPTLQDLDGPGKDASERAMLATATINADAQLARAGIGAALGPHATDTVSPALWARIIEEAQALDLPVHAHLGQSFEEFERAIERHDCSPVEFLERQGALEGIDTFLLVHALFVGRPDLQLLDPGRHCLGYCPYSQLIFGFPARILEWEEFDLPWFVATDCGASNDSMSVQKELRFIAGNRTMDTSWSDDYERFLADPKLSSARDVHQRRRQSLERWETQAQSDRLLARVWSTPGELHPRLKAGKIAPGYLANLLLWDLDHPNIWPGLDPLRGLAMSDTSQAIAQMMVAGQWLGRRHDFQRSICQSPELAQARAEAHARLEELLERIHI